MNDALMATLNPASVAILGASDNPDKIGGRPVHYMQTLGFAGKIYPINPARKTIQGLTAYPSLDDLPEVPDLAVIVVSGQAAVDAISDCARLKVRAAIMIASGFGEVDEAGRQTQEQMARIAADAGMRMVGPNSQGFANFENGAISSFSTMFIEYPPQDGPVAVISQSGALSAAVYGMLRDRDIGVRYMIATGNEADVTVADMTRLIVQDEQMKLILLYLETIESPQVLAQAAAIARERGLPIVAIKAGRTLAGQQMAASHTGSLANEDRVVDAFFEQHGILRVDGPDQMTQLAPMYLPDWTIAAGDPTGARMFVVSNSGASCVMAADAIADHQLVLAEPAPSMGEAILEVLPSFATSTNPIDLTGAVLQDSSLLGRALDVVAEHGAADCLLIEIPVAGQGYDLIGFAEAARAYAQKTNRPVAIAAWQPSVAKPFADCGLPVYDTTPQAMAALSQRIQHQARIDRPPAQWPTSGKSVSLPAQSGVLNEAESLAVLQAAGLPVVEHRICTSSQEARAAFDAIGAPVVSKACSSDVPHKSEHGLVALRLQSADAVADAFDAHAATLQSLNAAQQGELVARMHSDGHELLLGAHRDPVFGPVVVVGAGGKYVEALNDTKLLLPPFETADVLTALSDLQIAPVLAGVRGEAPADLDAFAHAAVALGQFISDQPRVVSADLNPVIVGSNSAVVVDALIELGD